MSLECFLGGLVSSSDPLETLISLCFIDQTIEEILNYLSNQLERVQKVSNSVKRKKLNDRLYMLVMSLKNQDPATKVSKLIFLDSNIHCFDLESSQIGLAKQYKLMNPYYKTEENFQIEYFKDFFLNNNFNLMIQFEKVKLQIKKFTLTKESSWTKDTKDFEKYLEQLKAEYSNIYIVGWKSTAPPWLILLEKAYSKTEFYDWKKKQDQIQNHKLLEKRLADIQNSKTNLDLYVFGKLKMEILQAIECYQLKELYIECKKLEKLKSFVDHTLLNFTIIPIFSIERGDVADNFINEYNGLMGIKYFA